MTADSEPAISPPVEPLPGDAPPGDPFAPIVERPRLRIVHLMFWTACVAVYLSMIRMLQETDPDTSTVFRNVWMLYGLGAGTGLAGLLVGVAWRFRGMPFPATGGEYVLVMTGIGPLVSLITAAIYRVINLQYGAASYTTYMIVSVMAGIFYAVIWCEAAVRTRARRWRVFFILEALSDLATMSCLSMMHISLAVNLLFLPLLAYLALRDWLERWRKPWTHWLGIGTHFWLLLYAASWRAMVIWFPEWLGLPS